MDAARGPHWDLGLSRRGEIMATYDTGVVGRPWVVVVARARGALQVSLFAPGDDVEGEGEAIGELAGAPREMGRQLRDLLSDAQDRISRS